MGEVKRSEHRRRRPSPLDLGAEPLAELLRVLGRSARLRDLVERHQAVRLQRDGDPVVLALLHEQLECIAVERVAEGCELDAEVTRVLV